MDPRFGGVLRARGPTRRSGIYVEEARGRAGIWFLIRKPALTGQVKFLLLLGFGVLPIGSAATGNVAGFEHTKHRRFCGSCHVMEPYRNDAENPEAKASPRRTRTTKNSAPTTATSATKTMAPFSTVMTKLGGMPAGVAGTG